MATKKVRYVGRYDEVEFLVGPDEWATVASGGTVEVPAALAESLCEQEDNWAPVDTAKKAPSKDEGDV